MFHRLTDDEARTRFRGNVGVGFVCGAISGGLEILDFETEPAYRAFVTLCEGHDLADAITAMPLSRSGRGGYHLLYRTDPCLHGIKLARTPDARTLIEFRGEGQYAIEAPSPIECGEGDRPYEQLRGNVDTIPTIPLEVRDELHDLCRSLTEYTDPARIVRVPGSPRVEGEGRRPGDHFNDEGDVIALLDECGYSVAGYRGEVAYIARPSKGRKVSATYHQGMRLFYMFSTSDPHFEADRWYQPFGVYTFLKHDGDFKTAAKALAAEGWGDALSRPSHALDVGVPDPVTARCACFGETDDDNAERLVLRMSGHFRYVTAWRKWYVYRDGRWQADETGSVTRCARETARLIHDEISRLEDNKDENPRYRWAKHSKAEKSLNAMIALARSNTGIAIRPTEFDVDPWLLNVQNGTLNLKTAVLQPHDPADFLTKMAPITYDPDARCPTWDAFLKRVVPDPEVSLYLRLAAGYSLTGSVREHCLFFLYGSGRNGKSTFMGTLLSMLGDYGKTAEPDMLMSKPFDSKTMHEVAELFGARYVVTSEPDTGKRFNEALVKRLTGGERRKGERKYENPFEYNPTDKIFLGANEKPDVRGMDEGIWSRLKMVPFQVIIPRTERDPDLMEKLKAEWPGILNWALAGCLMWQLHGLGTCAAVEAATAGYRAEMDSVGNFLTERCQTGSGRSILVSHLYTGYKAWAEQAGLRALSQPKFNEELRKRQYRTDQKTRSGIPWIGIDLVDPDVPPDYGVPEMPRKIAGAMSCTDAVFNDPFASLDAGLWQDLDRAGGHDGHPVDKDCSAALCTRKP